LSGLDEEKKIGKVKCLEHGKLDVMLLVFSRLLWTVNEDTAFN
jgi:hypothetical protein